MKFKILISLILITFKLFSQPYTPIFTNDKEWKVRYIDSIRVIKIIGDTLVNGKIYKILNSYNTGPFPWDNHLVHSFVREDSILKKCWVLDQNKTSERILYDFNLRKYDTIALINRYIPNPVEKVFLVDSVCNASCNKIFSLNNQLRTASIKSDLKVFFLGGQGFVINFEYIEGVGSIFAPVYLDERIQYVGGINQNWENCINNTVELICCKRGSEILYFKDCYIKCDTPKVFVSGIDEVVKDYAAIHLIINPNPAKSLLTITNPSVTNVMFKIFDDIGKQVLDGELEPNQTKEIDVINLTRGLYYIVASDFVTQKLIIK